jgi:hypothetical protein
MELFNDITAAPIHAPPALYPSAADLPGQRHAPGPLAELPVLAWPSVMTALPGWLT